jgi:hypothetical protein
MKRTIKRLAEHIIDQAGELGIQADALPDDAGIFSAEAVLHLRDTQRALNQARDALRLAIANGTGNEKPAPLFE